MDMKLYIESSDDKENDDEDEENKSLPEMEKGQSLKNENNSRASIY